MRKLFAALLTTGAFLLMSSNAMADTVMRFPTPKPADKIFPAGEICPFAIEALAVVNNEYTVAFFKAGASQPYKLITTGAFIATFTNLESGKSITVNASGPGKVTFNPDGTVTVDITGREVLNPGDSVGAGRTVLQFGPTGITFVRNGNYASLCGELS